MNQKAMSILYLSLVVVTMYFTGRFLSEGDYLKGGFDKLGMLAVFLSQAIVAVVYMVTKHEYIPASFSVPIVVFGAIDVLLIILKPIFDLSWDLTSDLFVATSTGALFAYIPFMLITTLYTFEDTFKKAYHFFLR